MDWPPAWRGPFPRGPHLPGSSPSSLAQHPWSTGTFSLKVYEQLETLQATLAGLSLEPEPAIRSPPSPQEDSYESTVGSALSSANLWQNPAKLSLAPAPLHRGSNQPEESEESEASIGPLSAALRSWHLSPSHTPGSPAPRVALGAPTPAGPDSWMQGGTMKALEGSWSLWHLSPFTPPQLWEAEAGLCWPEEFKATFLGRPLVWSWKGT